MHSRIKLKCFIRIFFMFALSSCAPGAAEQAVKQNQTVEISAPSATFTQPAGTPTATPIPTEIPTVSPATLSSQATDLCTAAFSSSVQGGEASAPLLTMSNNYYDEANPGGWKLTGSSELKHPSTEARSANDVQTVICVEEHRIQVGTYDDGAGAFQVRWNVRVVRWNDGTVVAEENFLGDEPSQMKIGGGDHYGFSPSKEYREWLLNLFAEDSVFVQGSGVSNLALSDDGQYLAITGSDFSAKIWNIASHTVVFEQPGESNILSSFVPALFSPDGQQMAMVYLGGINIVDVGKWTTAVQIKGIDIWSADYSEDGTLLATGLGWGYDGVRIYDANSGEAVNTFTLDTPANRILFSAGDTYLIASAYSCDTCLQGQSNGIYIWDFKTGSQAAHIENIRVQDMVLLGNGHILAVAVPKENDIRLYDILSGQQIRTLQGHEAALKAIAATPDGKMLASADESGTILLWNMSTGQIDQRADGYDGISTLAFSTDGKTLAVGSTNATVELWDIR